MRVLFWNIRGFGHDGRRRQLVEYMRDERIDIIAIQETNPYGVLSPQT